MVTVSIDLGSMAVILAGLTASGIVAGVANLVAKDMYTLYIKKHSRKIFNGMNGKKR